MNWEDILEGEEDITIHPTNRIHGTRLYTIR